MALNFHHLPAPQRTLAERIASIGFQEGYSESIIRAALQLCNQESSLGLDVHNRLSGAQGIWQYLSPAHLQSQLTEYKSRHPDSPISGMSAREVLANDEAVTRVVLHNIETWQRDFANHFIPAALGQKIQARPCADQLFQDFELYVMYRHNTSASQTQNKYSCHDGLLDNQSAIEAFVHEMSHRIAHTEPARMWVAGDQPQVLHQGKGAIRLPNGMSFVLSQDSDAVSAAPSALGATYLIHQGHTQTAILPNGVTVVSRPTAFQVRDPVSGHQQTMHGIGATLMQMPNGQIAVKPAHAHYAPFMMTAQGQFEDIRQPGSAHTALPLHRITDSPRETALAQAFNSQEHGILNPKKLSTDNQYQLAAAHFIPLDSTAAQVQSLLAQRAHVLAALPPGQQPVVLNQFDHHVTQTLAAAPKWRPSPSHDYPPAIDQPQSPGNTELSQG